MTTIAQQLAERGHADDADYLHESAGRHMVTSIPIVHMDTPVTEVLDWLRGRRFDCAETVFVTDRKGRLEGIVRLNDLFLDGPTRIGEIMEPEHESVGLEDDQETVAALAIRLGMVAVPVVDDEERLVGAVPPEAMFRILRAEHFEDLQLLAGINPQEASPEMSLDSPVYDRLRRRLPWLIAGLVASSLITLVMAGFERTIEHNVAAAFFVPALVYIAGAIGTQAVSVSVRALSADSVSIGPLLRDEMIIGVGIGLALGSVSGAAVLLTFGDLALSLAVGLAVLFGGAISSVVGFGLPWLFDRLGSDPALGSGPICTVIQDAASLTIYFLLISAFVLA